MKRQVLSVVLLSLPLACAPIPEAIAQSTAFTYNGRLNYNGAPVNGPYEMRFNLFDADAGGTLVRGPLTISPVAVTNGLFTTRLDFGANVFTGPARWLQIEVRPVGGAAFAALTPLQEVTSSPYAIRAQTAGTVATGSVVANQLNTGGVAPTPGQFLSYNGGSLFWSDPGVAAGNIWSRNGADTYFNAGNVGIGTNSPSPGVRLEVNGTTRISPGGSGGFLQFGTPSGETGMAIIGTNRADVRFDGLSLKMLAGPGQTPPGRGLFVGTNGNVGIAPFFIGNRAPYLNELLTVGGGSAADTKIQIDAGGDTYAALRVANDYGSWLWQVTPSTDLPFGRMRLTDELTGIEAMSITQRGNVGLGTPAPAHHLSIIDGPLWTASSWHGALELSDASAIGWRANAAGQRFGIGHSGGGLYFFRTASDPGTTGSQPSYDLKITDNGNLSQARDKGGVAKAMLFVNQDGTIQRCYNGITDSATGSCGFSVSHPNEGEYYVDFKFEVDDRFVSVTVRQPADYNTPVCASVRFEGGDPNRAHVFTFVANVKDTPRADTPFMIIVY